MKRFTGWQWLLINAANLAGRDKLTLEERYEWALANLDDLEDFGDDAGTDYPQYITAVKAIRKAQNKQSTGLLVTVDAVCSGMQIMSAMAGCVNGAKATGLVNTGKRPDAYRAVTDAMNHKLGGTLNVSRDDAKRSVMTSFYGSEAVPKEVFGEGSIELDTFYEIMELVAPGAWRLLDVLKAAWNPMALEHSWKLPDGFDAKVKVMQPKEVRIEVDELEHSTFTYYYKENQGSLKGISLVANCVHSVDAFVMREMHRRCNYNDFLLRAVKSIIEIELLSRELTKPVKIGGKFLAQYYEKQYIRSGICSVVGISQINEVTVEYLSIAYLLEISRLIEMMLEHKPFHLVTLHDAFSAHCNNIDQVRFHYKEILAEIADSNLLNDVLGQIKPRLTFKKLSKNLSEKIRESDYALT
jgi:hypothetical protein